MTEENEMLNTDRHDDLAQTYSDFYKSVHGIRPRWMNFSEMSEAEIEVELDRLQLDAVEIEAREAEAEWINTGKFEDLVQKTIEAGAKDRETALRWIMDGSDCNGDWEHLCFQYGLPYSYFNTKH